MGKLFDDLYQGLNEAVDYEKGNGRAKVTSYSIVPVNNYSKDEIKAIRNNAGMTQTVFADYMGVSKKTVEAWECGRSHPTGPACRLMHILSSGETEGLSFIAETPFEYKSR